MRPSSVRLVKETKITQKKGMMTKTPTRAAAGARKSAPARVESSENFFMPFFRIGRPAAGGPGALVAGWGRDEEAAWVSAFTPRGFQSVLTVFSSPTMAMTAALYWAIASSGESSPETTLSVMRWISVETLL